MSLLGWIHKWTFIKRYYQVSIYEEGYRVKKALEPIDGKEIKSIGSLGKFHFPVHNDETWKGRRWYVDDGRARAVKFDVLSSEPIEFATAKGQLLQAYDPVEYRKCVTPPKILQTLTEEKTVHDINAPPRSLMDEYVKIFMIAVAAAIVILTIWFVTQ